MPKRITEICSLLILLLQLISHSSFAQGSGRMIPIDSGERRFSGSTFCSYSSRGNTFLRTSVVSTWQDTLFLPSGQKLATTKGTIFFDELDPATGATKRLRTHECIDSTYMRGFTASPNREYVIAQYWSSAIVRPGRTTYKSYLEVYHFDTLLTTVVVEFPEDALHGLGLLVSNAGEVRIVMNSLQDVSVSSGKSEHITIKGGMGTVVQVNPRKNKMNQYALNLDMNKTIDKVWENESGEMRILMWDTEADTMNAGLSQTEEILSGRRRCQLLGIGSAYQRLWKITIETRGYAVIGNGILCDDGAFLITVGMAGIAKTLPYVSFDSSRFDCVSGDIRQILFCIAGDGKMTWNVNMESDGKHLRADGDIIYDGSGNRYVTLCNMADTLPDINKPDVYNDSLNSRPVVYHIGLAYIDSKSGALSWTELYDSCNTQQVEYFYRLPLGDYAVSGTFQDNRFPNDPQQSTQLKRPRNKFLFATIKVK